LFPFIVYCYVIVPSIVTFAGRGPFPGVIDMFGSAGGILEFRSALLASRGIAALALAYFAYDDLPTTFALNVEYFEVVFVNSLLKQSIRHNEYIFVIT
jgi:hypothetical protein